MRYYSATLGQGTGKMLHHVFSNFLLKVDIYQSFKVITLVSL